MTRRKRRLGPVLGLFESLVRIQNAVALVLHGRECPACYERSHRLEIHMTVNHAPWETR